MEKGIGCKMNLVSKVKEKREFSKLPDSVIRRALECSSGDVRGARALLRKYFGVFLTNRVLKGKGEEVLRYHLSSKKRDYRKFYREIFMGLGTVGSVVDLGCGVNGFSYGLLREFFGEVEYLGVEASGQLVDSTNDFFRDKKFSDASSVQLDLFDLEDILKILKRARKPRVIFLFQVVDALESLKKDFSKELISRVSGDFEKMVISWSLRSLGGKKRFVSRREWVLDFLMDNFLVSKNFEAGGERIVIVRKK